MLKYVSKVQVLLISGDIVIILISLFFSTDLTIRRLAGNVYDP